MTFRRFAAGVLLLAGALAGAGACDAGSGVGRRAAARASSAPAAEPPDARPDAPSPPFRNVVARGEDAEYAGDAACATCHADAAAEYAHNNMARSFHRWAPGTRGEGASAAPVAHPRSGLQYAVVEDSGRLWQVEYVATPDGRRLHELRRRVDWVMGSGNVARTYFTEENGRLFQLPLTLYTDHGWDFSPGYEKDNPRFERSLPDRCVACHASYPRAYARLEGKYAELRPGIGCERCHGPGALHVRTHARTGQQRGARAATPAAAAAQRRAPGDTAGYDPTIVNPRRLSLERRMDVCEQCHVHTDVTVTREGRGPFDYQPSQPLREQYAFFRAKGDIDLVSHADRLRQSACFRGARASARPMECATCHAPHAPPARGGPQRAAERNAPCATCHQPAALAARVAPGARAQHAAGADCVTCHMPGTRERTLPHGGFTDHWIRVPGADLTPNADTRSALARYVQGYYQRDRTGPAGPTAEAAAYQGMGAVVYAALAGSAPAVRDGAAALEAALGAAPAGGPAAGGAAARPAARLLLGIAYQQLGRPADALAQLERAVAADSGNPEALRALAQAWLAAGRPPEAAERLYARALAVQPRLAWMRAERAELLDALGRPAEAVAEYRAAVAEQPSLAPAWFHLGAALAGADRAPEAAAAFGRALGLDPTLGQALAPLVAVRTRGDRAVEAQSLALPLTSLLVRDRGPGALRVDAAADPAGAGVLFLNTPPGAVVRVFRYDGTPVRTLAPVGAGPVVWDLRTDGGRLVGGGLYRAVAQGAPAAGVGARGGRARSVLFGVARRPSS